MWINHSDSICYCDEWARAHSLITEQHGMWNWANFCQFLFSKGSLIQRDLWQVLWRSCWKNRVSGKLGTSYLSRQVSLLRINKFLRVERGVTGRTSAGLHCFKGHTRFPALEVVLQFASSPFSFSFFFSCFFSFWLFDEFLSSHYPLLMAGVLLLLFFNSIQSESAFILHYKITSECPCFFFLFFFRLTSLSPIVMKEFIGNV